ncbi:hypothetical protein B0H12DRAFT_1267593 [Mycena haematopus]|nr:hypothetical protein B0H12DRAFT_1267593 [Mycena haematopus]
MAPSTPRNASAGPSSAPNNEHGDHRDDPQTGQKRTARESPLRDETPIPFKKSRRAKMKVKPHQYHLKRDQVSEEHNGVKDAVFCHGYILLGITSSDRAPPVPTPELFAQFNERYNPTFLTKLEEKLRTSSSRHSGAAHMVKLLRDQATKDLQRGSQIAKNILRIGDTYLTTIFSALLSAGFTQWVPDILSPHDTVYNQAHEIVFIQTFKAVANSFGYRTLGPMPSAINNHNLITDLYRSFGFAYMRNKAKLHLKDPLKLQRNKDDGNASRRRIRLAKKRVAFALMDKLPERLHALFNEPECNSDDDSDTDENSGKRILVANAKSSRSVSATTFTHKFEDRRVTYVARSQGKKRSSYTETTRVRINNAVESDISFQLPKNVPIDWLAPETYNDLPAKIRYSYFLNGVALPLVQHHDKPDWKTMNKSAFMEKYGNEVLKLYKIPTEEEMDGAGNEGWEDLDYERDDEAEVDDLVDDEEDAEAMIEDEN